MEAIDLRGNLTVTAKIKAQMDDAPLALPPAFQEESVISPDNLQDNSLNDYIKTNTAIMQEFGDAIPGVIRNLQEMSNIISRNNQILASDNNTNVTKDVLSNKQTSPYSENTLSENNQQQIDSIRNSTDLIDDSNDYVKTLNNMMPMLIKNFENMNSVVASATANLPAIGKVKTSEELKKKQLESYRKQNLLSLLNTGNHSLQSLSGGNVSGAGINLISGAANISNTASKIADLKGTGGLSKGLLLGGGALMAGVAIAQGGKALADSYKEAMPTIFETGKAFGTTDDAESMRLYKKVNTYNNGTGLDIEGFNSVVQNLRKQGVGNDFTNKTTQAIAVSQIAETTSKWAYATGGNAEQYANLAGLMSRYGNSKDISSDFNYLVAAGKASGLNNSQIPEFLSGIQKVMEEGIAKGFSRSATEVADTMLMFSKISNDNPFWKGEQGARLINQANTGIASATGLNKSEDMLVFAAMSNAYSDEDMRRILGEKGKKGSNGKTSSYVEGAAYSNLMQMIERGLTTDNFDDIMDLVNTTYDSKDDRIEALRKITGLNYNGASSLYNLDYKNMSPEKLAQEIKVTLENPENENKETRWKKDLNIIAEAMQTGGEKLFGVELAGMDAVASGVNKLVAHFVGTEDPESPFSSNNQNEVNRDKKGLLTSDYEINKAEAQEKAKQLPEYQQSIIKAQTSASRFEPGLDGSGWNDIVDKYSNFDITKGNYDSPFIEKVDSDEAPFYIKYNFTMPANAREQAKRKWAQEKGYKITEPYSDDATISDFLLEPMQDKISSLLLSNDRKVSQAALMNAIEKSPEIKSELKKDVKDGYLQSADIQNLSKIMEKIYAELLAGITVNQTQ